MPHFSKIAEATSYPIVIYNIPGQTGVNMMPDTVAELANKYDNIVGYKAAEGKIDQIKEVIEKCPPNFVVMSGDDNLTYEIVQAGGKGVISVASNIIPERMQQFTEMMTDGDWDSAQAENEALAELFKTLFLETSPGPVKYALELVGQMTGTLRLPLVMPEPETRQKIKNCLINMGLLTAEEAAEKP